MPVHHWMYGGPRPRYKFIVTKAYNLRLNVQNKKDVPLIAYVYSSTTEH